MLRRIDAQQPAGLQPGSLEGLAISADGASERPVGTYILDNLDAFACTALPPSGARNELRLVQFPLDFEPVPCKPLLFDVARNSVQLPDLSAFQKQERRGLFGRIWGR